MDLYQRIDSLCLRAKHESITLVRRKLKQLKWQNIPHENTIRNIFIKFKRTGNVTDEDRSGRPSIPEEKKEEIAEFFEENPTSSIR